MIELTKDTLRHEAIKHRDRIRAFANEDPDEVCDLFFEAIKPGKGQVVALYWPTEKEFDPGAILERCLKIGILCALPVVQKDSRILRFALWQDGDALEEGPYNILQPAINEATQWTEPDIVIVPFLAFDRRGYRLGYGGGYYDATLADLRARKDSVAVGVGFAQQAVLFNLPTDPHDQRLDYVITPQQVHRFGD